MILTLAALTALALASRWWSPPLPPYWLGVLTGWLSGWLLRGIVERNPLRRVP